MKPGWDHPADELDEFLAWYCETLSDNELQRTVAAAVRRVPDAPASGPPHSGAVRESSDAG